MRHTSGSRKDVHPRIEALLEAVSKRTIITKHPWLVARDANMSPRDFEKKPLASEKPDACGGLGESLYVQVEKCKRRVD